MTDEFDHLLWAYRAVFKQTDAGGGSIEVVVTMNERAVLLYGVTGKDNYAANRTVDVHIVDENGAILSTIMSNASVDNMTFPFPVNDHSEITNSDGNQTEKKYILGKGDGLRLRAVSLVQNEELTISLRMLMRAWPPTITTGTSGGVVTTTETYNKVI